jgi:hypothetical protein
VFQDGQAFLLASTATGQTTLYQRTGPATWIERNTPIPATDGGRSCGLCASTVAGQLYGTDGIAVGSVAQSRLFQFDPSDNDTTLMNLPGVNWPVAAYSAAAGTDGLHLVTAVNLIGPLEHWFSADGQTWSNAAVGYNLSKFQVVGSVTGDVYLGGYNSTSSDGRLYWWDSAGSAWTAEPTSIVCSNSGSVSLLGGFFDDEVTLAGYDSVGMQLNRTSGTHTTVYTPSSYASAGTVWRGQQGLSGWFGLIGGADESAASVALLNSSTTDTLFNPLIQDDFRLMSQLVTGNHSFSSAASLTRSGLLFSPYNQRLYYQSSYGQLLNPSRTSVEMFGTGATEVLNFGGTSLSSFPLETEYRRTSSMATTRAWNAVSLISNLDGSQNRFEWTDGTGWRSEQLPPSMGNMMAPQVVAGYDGRWHIIYYDWVTDEVMIRSTL